MTTESNETTTSKATVGSEKLASASPTSASEQALALRNHIVD